MGCHRPPVPTHGSTEGLFHHSGARITFRCDPGFELRGFRSAICLSDGTWSAPVPECGRMMALAVFSAKQIQFRVWESHACVILVSYVLPQRKIMETCILLKHIFLPCHSPSAIGKSMCFTTQASKRGPLFGLWTK